MPPPAEGFAARFVAGPALRTQPDRRLVALVREGYENAFEEIVRRYGRALNRCAGAIVGNRAEDVTQDTFSKALLAMRRDEREIELRPWLFRIVRNTALNDLRDRPVEAEALAEAIAGGHDPAEELARREELTDLIERLGSLPETQRAAIVMRELEGLSHDEIAKALGLSGGAARQAIFRARRKLRDGLGMLLPLPLLKGLLAGTSGAPIEAGAAGIGGGAAGAGVALKAATATILVAGAVGAGVAIDHGRHEAHQGGATTTETRRIADDQLPASSASTDDHGANPVFDRDDSSGRRGRGGDSEAGDDPDHHRRQSDDHDSSSGPGPSGGGGDSSGGGGPSGPGGDDGGRSGGNGSSGPGSGSSPGGSGEFSGSGDGGPGGGGSSDNPGPGDESLTPTEGAVTETSSGSGDSSGSSGGGGSGSGSESISSRTDPGIRVILAAATGSP